MLVISSMISSFLITVKLNRFPVPLPGFAMKGIHLFATNVMAIKVPIEIIELLERLPKSFILLFYIRQKYLFGCLLLFKFVQIKMGQTTVAENLMVIRDLGI
jgi:hypothetical protein